MNNEEVNGHTIDTRFTWSGPRAREFLKLAKEEYGIPLPYSSINQLVKMACSYYMEAMRKAKINADKN